MKMNKGDYDPFGDFAPPDKPDPEKGDGKTDQDPPGPDYQAMLEEERQKREAAEKKMSEQQDLYTKRLEEFGQHLTERGAAKFDHQTPPDPEPDVTDKDFDASPSTAAEKLYNKRMKEDLTKVNEYWSSMVGNIAEQTYDIQLETFRQKEEWGLVGPEVEKFFQKNPNAKLSPKALSTIYKQYLGDAMYDGRYEAWRAQKEKERTEQHDIVLDDGRPSPPTRRHARVPADVPRTPPPGMPPARPESDVKLSADEQDILNIYKRYGVFEDEKDFRNWEQTIHGKSRPEIDQDLQTVGKV